MTRATPDLDLLLERMDGRLDELRAAGDRRERFLLMYRTFKGELRRNLEEGRFRDPAWAEAVCCRMGEMYFEADEAYRSDPSAAPAPWARCFEAATRRRTNLLQDMLLGMNAHINYDLPLGTFDVMDRFGDVEHLRRRAETSLRFRQLLRRRYYDFLLINEIAWESIPLIQDVICERFNRLLKYANLLSFRFTRRPTERIICEYRDRAWAHTLVLLTSTGDRSLAATRRHLASFALRAADLVDRITINPLKHLLPGKRTESDTEAIAAVGRVLVENLGYRPTRAIARQALEEYGPVVQPVIIRTLDQAPPLAHVRAQLYRVLAAHPTPDAVDLLARALAREREVRGELLAAAADVAGRAADPRPLREPALTVARTELATARRLLALGKSVFEGALLGEAVRTRVHRALARASDGLVAAGRDAPEGLPAREIGPGRLPTLAILEVHLAEVAGALGEKVADPWVDNVDEAAVALVEDADPWVRACAAWWIGTEGRTAAAAALVDRVRHDDHELVKETALAAAGRVLAGTELEDAARSLLLRRTYTEDTPARRLAGQITSENGVTMITTIEKVLHLKHVTLFQDVLAEDLVTIARVAREHRFSAGERLIEKDAPGEATYVIVEGEVEVTRGGKRLATIGPNGVLGEMSVVSDLPTSADCVAASKGTALRIARHDFHALLQDHPTTAIGVMHVLAQRLRETNVKVTEPHDGGG